MEFGFEYDLYEQSRDSKHVKRSFDMINSLFQSETNMTDSDSVDYLFTSVTDNVNNNLKRRNKSPEIVTQDELQTITLIQSNLYYELSYVFGYKFEILTNESFNHNAVSDWKSFNSVSDRQSNIYNHDKKFLDVCKTENSLGIVMAYNDLSQIHNNRINDIFYLIMTRRNMIDVIEWSIKINSDSIIGDVKKFTPEKISTSILTKILVDIISHNKKRIFEWFLTKNMINFKNLNILPSVFLYFCKIIYIQSFAKLEDLDYLISLNSIYYLVKVIEFDYSKVESIVTLLLNSTESIDQNNVPVPNPVQPNSQNNVQTNVPNPVQPIPIQDSIYFKIFIKILIQFDTDNCDIIKYLVKYFIENYKGSQLTYNLGSIVYMAIQYDKLSLIEYIMNTYPISKELLLTNNEMQQYIGIAIFSNKLEILKWLMEKNIIITRSSLDTIFEYLVAITNKRLSKSEQINADIEMIKWFCDKYICYNYQININLSDNPNENSTNKISYKILDEKEMFISLADAIIQNRTDYIISMFPKKSQHKVSGRCMGCRQGHYIKFWIKSNCNHVYCLDCISRSYPNTNKCIFCSQTFPSFFLANTLLFN
jgi:hypothetical protein